MTDTSPPPEAQRFGRSQTPESPRPVHIPEPSNIPVLLNQMDPVFNDTATYNIPHNTTFSPYSDPAAHALNDSAHDEQDAVQNFLRGAEEENARLDKPALPEASAHPPQSDLAESNAASAALLTALANAAATIPPPSNHNGGAAAPTAAAAAAVNNTMVEAIPAANGVATGPEPEPTSTVEESKPDSDPLAQPPAQVIPGEIDYQSLLDTISQSASTAPAADPVSAPTTAASQTEPGLPPIPGLPPKPPIQTNAPEYSSYSSYGTAQAYSSNPLSQVHVLSQPANDQTSNANGPQPTPHEMAQAVVQNYSSQAPGQAPGPLPTGQAPGQPYATLSAPPPSSTYPGQSSQDHEMSPSLDPNERPWTPVTQRQYDQFLEAERRYVTEGIWDKFPQGSRLFVGNLPSEKVTKRDLFHTFHKHGQLAQISIKQAYGFVQYLEAASCAAALNAEQGVEIRGRKIHLEISKPQKNTRNQNQNNKRRRSRSPDRGNSRNNDRFRPDFPDHRRRDDYRPARSPSPRRYDRADYRNVGQSPRYPDGRPRSPYSSFAPAVPPVLDEEASLPLPRRDPREVPDVQLLILDPKVAQSFINWIEQGFRQKGLRASTIWLSARLPLQAVIKRQIIEGVQAIVKLTSAAQYNSKIPLQVFDRSAGASNINFNEYADLDIPIAADIVLHARQKERGSVPPTPSSAYPHHGYPQPPQQFTAGPPPPQFPTQLPPHFQQPGQQQQQQQHSQFQYNQHQQYPQQVQTPVTPNSIVVPNAAAPNLQQLLANLRQPGDSQAASATSERPPTDLANLLSNVAAQRQSQGGQYPPHPQGQQGQFSAPAYGSGQSQQNNVQNIMEQLARYNR